MNTSYKHNIILLFLILASLPAFSQFRMIGTASWTVVTDSTYSGTINFQVDLTGKGYLATSVVDTFRVFTGTEQIYTITTVGTKTFSSAQVTIKEYNGDHGIPIGQVMVYDPAGKTTLPQAPFGSTGSTAQLQAAIDTYNARLLSSAGVDLTPYSTTLEMRQEISDSIATVTGLADGDKGDITVSGSGATWTIDANAVDADNIATNAVGPDEIAPSGVAAASYTAPNITVDQDGRITSATSNTTLVNRAELADTSAAIRSDIPAAASTNTVHVIATLADTTTIVSPVEADIAWVSSDTIAFRSGAMWRVFIDDNNSSMYTGGTFETGTTNDLLEDAIASYSTRFRSPSIGTWMGITSDTANNKLGLRWSTLQGTHEVMSSSSGLQLLSGSDLTFRLSNSLKRFYFDGTFDTDDTNTTALAVDPVSFELERVSIVTPDMLSDSLSALEYDGNGIFDSSNDNETIPAGMEASVTDSLKIKKTNFGDYRPSLVLEHSTGFFGTAGGIALNYDPASEATFDYLIEPLVVTAGGTRVFDVAYAGETGIALRAKDTLSMIVSSANGPVILEGESYVQLAANTGSTQTDSLLIPYTAIPYDPDVDSLLAITPSGKVAKIAIDDISGSAGITSLNGLTGPTQTFATGTGPLAWSSTGTTHTLNIPNANASTRGFVSTTAQTFAGDKTFSGTISAASVSSNFISTPILTASGLLIDGNSSAGSAKQVLGSTGTGVDWVDGGSWAEYAQSYNTGGENTSITAGVPEPINLTTTGTITEVAETSQFTIAANGNIQYTGPSNSVIEIEIDGSVSTGGAAQMYYYVSISGTTQATSRTRHDHDGAGYEHFSIKWIDTDADAGDTYSVSVEPVTGTESVTISDLRITATKIK